MSNEGRKDLNGFELQDTMPPKVSTDKGRKQPVSAETPKVPANRNSAKDSVNTSKSSSAPRNSTQRSSGSVENGHDTKSKAEEAEDASIGLNVKYLVSWQCVLKILKLICFVAMLVSSAIPVSGLSKVPKEPKFATIWERLPTLQFALAVAAIGLIVELTFFIIYLIGLNRPVYKYFSPLPFVMLACNLVVLILIFIVPIRLSIKEWHGPAVTSYLAFNSLSMLAYALDLYFNIMWLTGSPELSPLPIS
ncbi:uncharacterized protein [Watersipora subatra]|uniref:uncharacterized protein n=1 Tax=Watersipora subatra TaxID=2589382 RepID=UPI00355AEF3E